MFDPDTAVPLPQLAARLRALGCPRVPAYSTVYRGIVDGRIPVERHNGRIYILKSDLPLVAEIIGFHLPGAAA